jgi:glutamyl-tRNA synthetase
MKPVVRFAPSPTGLLHIGNARTALVNWLFAQHHKGTFILRLDDTDLERSKEEYTQALLQDLKWLGVTYEAFHQQSKRLDRYDNAVKSLKKIGRLYPCYETPRELDFKRRLQRTQGLPPLYDRAALNLSEAEKKKYENEGRKPHWRFLLNAEAVSWDDLSRGELRFEQNTMSDPILIREDGTPVYTLSSVVDDIELGVTHIIRGEDHISNTAVQIQLLQALEADITRFTFAHLPLLVGEQGESLSKRFGSLSLQSLRQQGIESLALVSYLVKLGTSEDIAPAFSGQQLIEEFNIKHFGRSSPRFSMSVLERLNAKFLHHVPYGSIKPRLKELELDDIDNTLWEAIHGNINKLQDVAHFRHICQGQIHPKIEDKTYVQQALELLPPEPWDKETWQEWTLLIKEKTGRRGKELFMPLRLALTGEANGPEMHSLLPLIGRTKAEKRLAGIIA